MKNNQNNKKFSLLSRLTLKIILAIVLMLSLSISAFAAISQIISVYVNDINAATYAIEVTEATSGNSVDTTYVCPAADENIHSFTLKAEGSASTGYGIITIGDNQYITTQIDKGESITIYIKAAENTQIEFASSWGKSTFYNEGNFEQLTEDGESIIVNPFAGKKISVMGDSISTYTGWSDARPITSEECKYRYGEAYYGPAGGDFHNTEFLVTDTWWHQAATQLGAEILVSNAGNSTGLLYASYPANAEWQRYLQEMLAYKTRPYYLGTDEADPDIIALYIGSSDVARYSISKFGSVDDIDFDTLIADNGDGSYTYAEPVTVAEAYAILLHKVSVTYPEAEVYCFMVVPNAGGYLSTCNSRLALTYPYNEMIKGVAGYYGAITVDLLSAFQLDPDGDGVAIQEDWDKFKTYFHEDPHPNADGFDVITECFVSAVLENSKYNK